MRVTERETERDRERQREQCVSAFLAENGERAVSESERECV